MLQTVLTLNINLERKMESLVANLDSAFRDTIVRVDNLETSVDEMKDVDKNLASKVSRLTRLSLFAHTKLMKESTVLGATLDNAVMSSDKEMKKQTQKVIRLQEKVGAEVNDQLTELKDYMHNELPQAEQVMLKDELADRLDGVHRYLDKQEKKVDGVQVSIDRQERTVDDIKKSVHKQLDKIEEVQKSSIEQSSRTEDRETLRRQVDQLKENNMKQKSEQIQISCENLELKGEIMTHKAQAAKAR